MGSLGDTALLGAVLVAVVGFLVFTVTINDLADEAIDRINLPADPSRPLVAGSARRQELIVVSITAAVLALAASATIGWPAVAITAGGLALSAGYSLKPVRLAERGAVASLVLPAGYVAVPYLIGLVAGHGSAESAELRAPDLWLLAGLYLGFIGRLLLKDFRDLRGDVLFGKRTFLVRYGRVVTCRTSAVCWAVGMVVLAASTRQPGVTLLAGWAAGLVGSLVLLHLLSRERNPRRDEALISALAIIGRSTVLLLLVHLALRNEGWIGFTYEAIVGILAVVLAGQTWSMARRGPQSRWTAPVMRGSDTVTPSSTRS